MIGFIITQKCVDRCRSPNVHHCQQQFEIDCNSNYGPLNEAILAAAAVDHILVIDVLKTEPIDRNDKSCYHTLESK